MKTATLPRIVTAGRGEHWVDYGHHEDAEAFIWCGPRRGFVVVPGHWQHGEILEEGLLPSGRYSTIIGRIDGPTATMYYQDPRMESKLDDFVMALAERWPEVRTIRNFIDD